MRVAVLGHVEWVEFARVDRVPSPGEIVTAGETWCEAAGGGGVAAVELARLAGGATLVTALGDDELGHRAAEQLSGLGVRVEAVFRPEPQRRCFVFLDSEGERTITVIGEKLRPRRAEPLPWEELATFDAVYFTAGDAAALRAAREASVLVATARELATLREGRVALDALVSSSRDAGERYRPGDLDPPPTIVVRTAGADGGTVEPGGISWGAAAPAGPLCDAYGAGDSFAAGLTYGLGVGLRLEDALELAAARGSAALERRGAHGLPSDCRATRIRPGR